MRFVPIRTGEQQAVLALHRAQQTHVKTRTARAANQMRDLLAGTGSSSRRASIRLPNTGRRFWRTASTICRGIPWVAAALGEHHPKPWIGRLDELKTQIQQWHRETDASQTGRDPGVSPLTASALVATIGSGSSRADDNWRPWLGLVPGGIPAGQPTLLGIKAGDVYLRTLLIHGARRWSGDGTPSRCDRWLAETACWETKPEWAAVALANKECPRLGAPGAR